MHLIYENFWGWEMKQPPDFVLNCFELFFWGWEMKQPLIPFWTVLGMRIEATPESAQTVIRPVTTAARIPDADAARIPMFLRNFLIWEFRSPPPPRCCYADSWRCCCADSNVRLIWSLDLMKKLVIYFFLIDKITKLVQHKPRAHPTFR
jgi:hypothetical protein